jgi:molybdopterin-containing oxidoreductase family iron-sulfur binding subunit
VLNPVYTLADSSILLDLKKVKTSVSLTLKEDETALVETTIYASSSLFRSLG